MKNKKFIVALSLIIIVILTSCSAGNDKAKPSGHEYNGSYSGKYLARIAFPIGGIGAGMFCLEGTGAISHMSVRNRPEMFNEPCMFAAISVKGLENGTKILEGQVPAWKHFGQPGSGNGSSGASYGLPRFENASFLTRFPFAEIALSDKDIPLEVQIRGWSPFIPTDAGTKEKQGDFAVFTTEPGTIVDHCWFRGGWWDPLTMTWNTIMKGDTRNTAPVDEDAPGASLYVPVSLNPGETRTIRLMMAWFVPNTNMKYGQDSQEPDDEVCTDSLCSCHDPFYKPWYTIKFTSINEVADFWKTNYKDLQGKSELFSNAFYNTTLPPEVIEAIAANLTILKSPTCLRQPD